MGGADLRRVDVTASKRGLAAVSEEEFDILSVIGGWRVVAEATIPTVVFLVGLRLTGDYVIPAIAALCVTAIAAISRLLRRLPVRPALIGVVSMSLSVFVAWKTGQAVNVFALSILKNMGYGSLVLLSILVRWPLLGLMLGAIRGEGTRWRKGEEWKLTRVRYYQITWLWFFVFVARLSAQIPLYFAGNVGWLALMKLAFGMPLDAMAAFVTWKLVRSTRAQRKSV